MITQSDVGRVFLQSIISRHVISDKLLRVLFEKSIEAVKVVEEDVRITLSKNDFDQHIQELNGHLESVDFKIASTIDETTGAKIWAFINTKSDELAQLATHFSPVEIAYFKAVVEQIILASSESYSVSSMTALREVTGLAPKKQASHPLSQVDTYVHILSRRGRYSLSSRTLLELQTYLKAHYEDDIHECTICYELLTKGIGCYTLQCGARLHDHCYKRFARDNRASSSCPTCQVDWSDASNLKIIGEGALPDGQDSRIARKRRDTYDQDISEDSEQTPEESEHETNMDSSPEPTTNGKSQGKNKGKGKGKGKARFSAPPTSDEDSRGKPTEPDPVPQKGRLRRRG
ncbi:hypothetical protein Clacol_006335 [Clathrus columnatus]|uniref:Non-structural maintenance of chromosomes element 1 homolog n=1 Tax=Clathrus columnatus TaxID=1419009 RepID=A0AAV5AFZ1_9AGAM|nr:hypothetical protein Clacol_006335 [Clathrus columnatus]